MKRAMTAMSAGAVLLAVLTVWGPSVTAQQQEAVEPISIYSLDDGSLDDTVGDPALTTDPGESFGDPQATADRDGNPTGALACDGVDDYVQLEEDSNINPLTFSFWFRADDVSGQHSILDSDVSGQYGHSVIIGYDDPADPNDTPNDGSLSIQYHNGVWDTDVVINEGEWTQVFVTYSGDRMRVYLGTQTRPTELVAELPYDTSPGFDGSNFRLCQHNPGDPKLFEGAIDDVRFYDTPLTIDEIEEVSPPVDPDTSSTTESEPEPETTETTESEPSSSVPSRRERAVPPPTLPPTVWGDVHVRTPDSLVYDFQFMGDFVIAESDDGSVAIQTRMQPWRVNPEVSVNTKAAIDVAGDVLVFSVEPELTYTVNDVATDVPTGPVTLPNGGTITVAPAEQGFRHDLAIVWPDGNTSARVKISSRPFIDVAIGAQDGDLVYSGIAGNLDGDPLNDMQVRDGEVIEQPATAAELATFGDSWRVEPDETLFSDALPEDELITPGETITLDDLDEAARAEAEAACAASGITDPLSLHNCTYDVAATGDEGFTESAEAQQEAVEALPEVVPEVIVALPGAAPPEVEAASAALLEEANAAATSEADDDDDGPNTLLFLGLGVVALILIAGAAILLKRSDDANRGTPPPAAGPPPGPAPTA